MTIPITLADAGGKTEVSALHDHLPPGPSPGDNRLGWQLSLTEFAALTSGGDGRG